MKFGNDLTREYHLAFIFLAVVCLCNSQVIAEVNVTELITSQRPDGSGLVDIRFDLVADEPEVTETFVTISISPDGGQSWPITSFSAFFTGDVGADVAIGTDKHVVWDAAADRPEVLWPNCRVRVMTHDWIIGLPGEVLLELVRIPAASFVMGSPPDERSRYSNEGPQTNVTLTQDFYMGKYELTQAQWLAVIGAWPGTAPSSVNGIGPNHPAYYVSWNDTQNFITALNAHITATGQAPTTMRLPTEAEWEYACRAGTTTRFHFGDSLIGTSGGDDCEDDGLRSQYMWYCGSNSPYGSKPVGGKLSNAFGLYDMNGNVNEWCQDWYRNRNPGGNVTDPTGPTEQVFGWGRVIRGANGDSYTRICRSAYRDDYDPSPSGRNSVIGFRLVSFR